MIESSAVYISQRSIRQFDAEVVSFSDRSHKKRAIFPDSPSVFYDFRPGVPNFNDGIFYILNNNMEYLAEWFSIVLTMHQ